MSVDLGDRIEDSIIHFMWSTNAADGSSVTRATDGTISVYKNDDLTQSVAGITDTEDVDAMTGIHLCTIDTNADAFYTANEDYTVVLSGAVIDGMSANGVLAIFSIENRFMRGTDGANVIIPDAAGVVPTALENQQQMDISSTRLAAIESDTSSIQTDWTDGGRLDSILDVIAVDTATDIPTLIAATQSDLNTITGIDGVTLATLQSLYSPNTVIPDAAGVAPTVEEIRVEMDSNSTRLDANISSRSPTNEYDTEMGYIPADLGDVATITQDNSTHGSGSWLTGAGGSSPTVEEIRIEMDGNSTRLSAIEADTTGIAGSTMRGTDGANITIPPTVEEIRVEMDSNSTRLDANISSRSPTNEYDTEMGYIPADLGDVATITQDNSTHGSGSWLTGAGGSSPTVEEIRIEMDGNSTRLSAIEADTTGIAGSTMRGTDGANITIPPTVEEIRVEMDSNSTRLDANISSRSPTNEYDTEMGYIPADLGDVATITQDNSTHGSGSWLTGAGGSSPTVEEIRIEMDGNSTRLSAIEADTTGIAGSTMRGTDGANITIPPTVEEIRVEMDSNSTRLDANISSRSPTNEYDTEMGRIDVNVSSRNAIEPNTVIPDVAGTAATLHGVTDALLITIDGIVDDIKSKTDNLPSGITKNEALPRFDFLMVLSSDHITAATEKTVTGEISKDGGIFTGITNVITEVSSGMYTIANGLTQTEMDADVITLKFDEFECDTRIITLLTT